MLFLWIPNPALAGGIDQPQVCDVSADYSLGIEDYPGAIRRHLDIVRAHPQDALAHYHLGFAFGMLGDRTSELREYRQAKALGLKAWDLFLNLGLAQLEQGDLGAATDTLRTSVLLGDDHPETHFNLALAEQRSGMLADAEHETLASLLLNPDQPDARNLLGVIYAGQGNIARASLIWRDLVRDLPDYQPARANLALLGSPDAAANGEAAADLPRPAAVHAIMAER